MYAVEKYISRTSYTIASQIRYFRERRGMTQEQLAVAAKMKQSAIARLENIPDEKWSWRILCRLGSALDVRISADITTNETK